jgi:hypothetical protein
MSGNGLAAPIPPTPGFNLPVAQWANTMESLCPTRWFYEEVLALAAATTFDPPIAISFILTRVGNS